MPAEPNWVPIDDVIGANRQAVAATSEPFTLIRRDLLESALGSCLNAWHYGGERDLVVLACILMRGIARNQAFIQGNKRTGFLTGIIFLRANGFEVSSEMDDSLVEDVYLLESGQMTIEDFVAKFKPFTSKEGT